MIEQIQYFLEDILYTKLDTGQEHYRIFFRLENNFVNAIHVIDCDRIEDLTQERLEKMMKPIQWKASSGASVEVHMLSLLLTAHVEEFEKRLGDNMFVWILDTSNRELVVPEGKAQEFYGLRRQLSAFLAEPFEEEAYIRRREERKLPQQVEDVPKISPVQWFFRGSVVNHMIVVVNILVFFACILTGEFLYDQGARVYEQIVQNGQWYRIITSMFLHADSSHLFSNMLWLVILGDIVERMSGRWKYLILYLGAGICGDLLSMYLEYSHHSFASSVGASGAVFGIEGALLWILISNHGRVQSITVPKILFSVALSLYYGYAGTNIDNAAHLGGFIGGFLLAILLYRRKNDEEGIGHEN
jgi:rhomboid protease GluP